jgi:hypothetical protein
MTLRLAFALGAALLCACGSAADLDGSSETGAAHPGVDLTLDPVPEVNITDEAGTDIRVWVKMRHLGGPDAESFEVVSASLGKDLMPFSDIELSIPADHDPFTLLMDGEEATYLLTGSIDSNGSDWGLCASGADEETDELRVTMDLHLRITPGANDEADDFVIESQSVALNCVFVG